LSLISWLWLVNGLVKVAAEPCQAKGNARKHSVCASCEYLPGVFAVGRAKGGLGYGGKDEQAAH
jgi:hypothetical protein